MSDVLQPKDNRRFQVMCSADPAGSFSAGAEMLSVTIGQRISASEGEEIWDSVVVQCREEADGIIGVRVLVCNPQWDGPIQVAHLRSIPALVGPPSKSLMCSLEQVKL